MSLFCTKICLVDDDPLYSDFLSKSLKNKNFKVNSFSSGIEMLEKQHTEPDIILMDLQMEIMDGIQASRIVKKKWPRVKIVLISSSECAENILNEASNHFDSYEPKTKDLSGIYKQVIRFEKRKRLRITLAFFGCAILAGVSYYIIN
jgi:CheY-like chemotaxis protein